MIGSTGLVGSQVLQDALVAASIDRVYAISRKPIEHPGDKLQVLRCDLDQLPNLTLPADMDAGIICLGTTLKTAGSKEKFLAVDHSGILNFARLCKSHNIRELHLVSSVGASSESPSFYLNTKGKVEQSIIQMNFEALHIYRPSLLLGARKEKRVLEGLGRLAAPLLQFLLRGPLSPYRPISARALSQKILSNLGNNRFQIHQGRSLFTTYQEP